MNRRNASALGIAIALAAVAGDSLASPQFTATLQETYLSKAPHSSSGQRTLITWSDPGEPGGKPKAIKRFVLQFHRGTRFDTSALPACKASDLTVQREGLHACPARTRLGGGHTEAIASGGFAFTTDVTFFNARGHIIVLVQVDGRTLTNFRDTVRDGTIHVNTKIPGGVSLTKLDVTIPARSRKIKRKRHTYMRTPATCPASGSWTTNATLVYVDGSEQRVTSDTPCRR